MEIKEGFNRVYLNTWYSLTFKSGHNVMPARDLLDKEGNVIPQHPSQRSPLNFPYSRINGQIDWFVVAVDRRNGAMHLARVTNLQSIHYQKAYSQGFKFILSADQKLTMVLRNGQTMEVAYTPN